MSVPDKRLAGSPSFRLKSETRALDGKIVTRNLIARKTNRFEVSEFDWEVNVR